MACVPTTLERLSRVDGILPPGHGFDAESSKDVLSIEARILAELRQSTSHLRTSFGLFKEMQDARCKPFEDEASVVVSQIQRQDDSVRLGHEGGNEERTEEAVNDGARVDEDVLPKSATVPMHESAPASDLFVDDVHGSDPKNDDASVPSEKVADKAVSGTSCSDGLDQTEPQPSIGAGVSDAEQGKTAEDIISEKGPIKAAVDTCSARAGMEKSPAAVPSVVVDADSPALPAAAQATVFVALDSPAAPAATGVLADDTAMSTGDDDEETESDSMGKEDDLSIASTGLGKNPKREEHDSLFFPHPHPFCCWFESFISLCTVCVVQVELLVCGLACGL